MHISHQQTALSPYQMLSPSGAATTASPAVSANDTSASTADTSGATITANDFLTLLVSEMKNQDPTSDTDPNEYIDQLVQVNSLEQLIQINTDLSSGSSADTSGDAVKSATQTGSAMQGNLGASDSGLDAGRIATSLGGRSETQTAATSALSGSSSSSAIEALSGTLPAIPSSGESSSSATSANPAKRLAAFSRHAHAVPSTQP
jgi:flagellar basal-body rod modification protein FlgD